MKSKPLLVTIPDPDANPKSGKTIQQFTKEGLEVAAEYYNQKYPERGKIENLVLVMKAGDLWVNRKEENEEAVTADIVEKLSDQAKKQLCPADSENFNGRKIILTIAREDNELGIKLDHSNPFVLTDKKLILMRDDHEKFGKKIYQKIADRLDVELV